MFEVREELHAVVAATATLPCVCRAGATCIPCRARMLLREISTRGIRIRRWRNDLANPPRHVAHIAGAILVEREPRPSCPRYIIHRAQVCAACGEPLATGKWALFFIPGEVVTMLRGRDGAQLFPTPLQSGVDAISCAVLAERESVPVLQSCYYDGARCAMITPMDPSQAVETPYYVKARLAYGWAREGREVVLVPEELAIRSTILQLFHIGYQYSEIAEMLNDAGYPSRNGIAWQKMVVRRIVEKPVPRKLLHLLADQTASVPLHAALVGALKPKPITISKERKAKAEKRQSRKHVTRVM